ncbi:MAG: hypothetical protein C4548_05880 [Desulfobacteraceae bacterium]|jgi:hypothetical protein|nr:MAG: hypothetical protein C4548_05880 [Desulfobacteraceae bacterium]
MDQIIEQLFEAHVQHELNRFKPRAFQQTIREETAALFQWINNITLREIVTPEQIIGVIDRNVVKLPIAGGITELTGEMSRRVLAAPQNKTTTLEDIFPRKPYDDIVDKIGGLEKARQDLIHNLVNSSIYSQQISEVLFTGIKEYLLTENIFAQKVPGLASLIKIGKFAVNKTLHPLEVAVEKTVKSYIEKNLGNTIRRSEKSLNAYFDEAHIIEMGDEIWTSVSEKKLSEYFTMVDAGDMEDFIIIGYDFWLHFRKTPYFKAIYTDLVYFFFEKYGDRELDLIAEDVGVTEEMVVDELVQTLSHGVKKALAGGFLEARIRARLENFYLSPETAILASSMTGAEKTPVKAKTPRPPATKEKPAKKSAIKKNQPKGKP